jgi:hypothetical protein
MAGDLVKAGQRDQSLVRASDARRAMREALVRLRRTSGILKTHDAQPVVIPVRPQESGEIVDLPRVCAVHDRPYVARYIADGTGRFRHAQTIRITERLCEQYEANRGDARMVPSGDVGEETCPWCGASGPGSVRCGLCRVEVCYGGSYGKHFRCRESCGAEGDLVPDDRAMRGVTPSLPPASAPGSGRT